MYSSDITIDTKTKNITLIDTGIETQTGGRIKRVKNYLKSTFCLTYGDGLSDVNISKTIKFHKKNKKLATMTTVQPTGRFGAVNINKNLVNKFIEKPKGDGGWINAGFFVLNKKVIDFIKDDSTIWEKTPLMKLSQNKQLVAFKHTSFWHPMDTLRDKEYLEQLWNSKNCPWEIWNDR